MTSNKLGTGLPIGSQTGIPIQQIMMFTVDDNGYVIPVSSNNPTPVIDIETMIVQGRLTDYQAIHKFGRNDNVSTSFVPVCMGGNYRTPQVSDAKQLRIKAGGDASDIYGGSGAWKIIIIGLDINGNEISEELQTNGVNASSATTNTYFRLTRFYVSETGTYALQDTPSHVGSITLEASDGSQDWGVISSNSFPRSQSEIGAFTIPTGYDGYITKMTLSVDSNKSAHLVLFQRQGVLKTAPPYDAMRSVNTYGALSGFASNVFKLPLGPFPEQTDIGFMSKVTSGTADVSVNFDIMMVKNGTV